MNQHRTHTLLPLRGGSVDAVGAEASGGIGASGDSIKGDVKQVEVGVSADSTAMVTDAGSDVEGLEQVGAVFSPPGSTLKSATPDL